MLEYVENGMQPHTTTNHAEYGERIEPEASSAGIQTRRLSAPEEAFYTPTSGAASPATPTHSRRRNNLIALSLIAVGVIAWLGRIGLDPGAMTVGMVLLTISSCFLFFAFWKRIYGLLIPGCILAGLSIGVPLAEASYGTSVLWGLSAGFFAILSLGRTLFNTHTPWPIFPAVILFAVGMIIAFANLPAFLGAGLVWLPLLLVAVGLYLGWGRRTA